MHTYPFSRTTPETQRQHTGGNRKYVGLGDTITERVVKEASTGLIKPVCECMFGANFASFPDSLKSDSFKTVFEELHSEAAEVVAISRGHYIAAGEAPVHQISEG